MKSLDVYISLHRAEGFGLTCAEAMAASIPTIATGYSGNMEFMTAQNSLLVPASVIRTERPYMPYPRGTLWGDPDQEAAVDAIRAMLDEDARRDLGARGASSVKAQLSLETLSARMMSMLGGAPAAARAPEAVG
jgi:glycosyltransferase involved in cell wall biosynthesis